MQAWLTDALFSTVYHGHAQPQVVAGYDMGVVRDVKRARSRLRTGPDSLLSSLVNPHSGQCQNSWLPVNITSVLF